MPRALLALNAGSTSLKAALFSISTGTAGGIAAACDSGRATVETAPTTQSDSIGGAGDLLDEALRRLPESTAPPTLIAHRIVHGGDRPGPVELVPATLAQLDALSPLAPLHQPVALALVRASMQRWPDARQVGVFDTSWHRTMPEVHQMFAIPHALYLRGVKRYGFHGIAFQSAMRKLGQIAPELARGRVVLAHLGGGSSLCAVRDGCSIATTMGMTPLDGIPMSSRPGSLDPGLVLHLQRELAMGPHELDQLLWHECGLRGLSGESGDMRALLASDTAGARRAVDVYVSALVQGIAGMASCTRGMDALVFSGGIGAHAAEIRSRATSELAWIGVGIDPALNDAHSPEFSAPGALVRSFALAVDEALELALAASSCVDAMAGPRHRRPA